MLLIHSDISTSDSKNVCDRSELFCLEAAEQKNKYCNFQGPVDGGVEHVGLVHGDEGQHQLR